MDYCIKKTDAVGKLSVDSFLGLCEIKYPIMIENQKGDGSAI